MQAIAHRPASTRPDCRKAWKFEGTAGDICEACDRMDVRMQAVAAAMRTSNSEAEQSLGAAEQALMVIEQFLVR